VRGKGKRVGYSGEGGEQGKRRRGVYGGYPVRCRFIGLGDLTCRSCFFLVKHRWRFIFGKLFVPHRCAWTGFGPCLVCSSTSSTKILTNN